MKGLILYGAMCTPDVWNKLENELNGHNAVFVEYPHYVTEKANSVSDITEWVYENYKEENFEFIIGHSMGGIIGLQLAVDFNLSFEKMIFIESNLKPAKAFYRNLMLSANMEKYGEKVTSMINGEAGYYSDSLKRSIQEDFDYTGYVRRINSKIYGIYGDRGKRDYSNRISDLCLDDDIVSMIDFRFVENSCHMPMIENPKALADIINSILKE